MSNNHDKQEPSPYPSPASRETGMPGPVTMLDANDADAVRRCFPVFAVLRPHLSEAQFMEGVRVQASEGYRIVYIEQDGDIAAAAGFRIAHFLAWGRVLYIDDLITHPEKKKRGLGGRLLDWLVDEAKRQGCAQVDLDTGFARHDAHRLYLNKGFVLACHHMTRALA